MSDAALAAPKERSYNKPAIRTKNPITPNKPLKNVRRERLCQFVVTGMKLQQAYEEAGFEGKDPKARWMQRNEPEVVARVNWLLEQRVEQQTRASIAPEKNRLNRQDRIARELERIAFGDVRSLVSWERKAELDQDGNVVGMVDAVVPTASHKLSRDAAAMVKGISTKAGSVKIEAHDKLRALEALAKIEGMGLESSAPPPSVTVNNLTVQAGAIDDVRRIAFLLAAAENAPKPMETLTIEHVPAEPLPVDQADRPPLKKRGRKPAPAKP
jgi:hypothetical protein